MAALVCMIMFLMTFFTSTEHYITKFQTFNRGFQFQPTIASIPIAIQNSIQTLTRCSMLCAADTRCQTVDFDYSFSRCRFFAEWIYEGSLIPSMASQIAYLPPKSVYYQLYNQTCQVTSEDHRFLQCIDGRWTCQPNSYWNGTACSRGRTFNQSCPTNNWCDRTRYLICLNVTRRCGCNHSMTWTGSRCTPICPPGQMGITFDDLSNQTDLFTLAIPNGYAQLDWSNIYVTMPMANETGYLAALRTPPYVSFNSYGSTMYFSHPTKTFTLNSIFVTSAHISNNNVEFKASPGNFRTTVLLDIHNSTLVTFNNWTTIDTVQLQSLTGGNDQIAIDNICITL